MKEFLVGLLIAVALIFGFIAYGGSKYNGETRSRAYSIAEEARDNGYKAEVNCICKGIYKVTIRSSKIRTTLTGIEETDWGLVTFADDMLAASK